MTNYSPTYLLIALTFVSLIGAHSVHAQERYIYWIGGIHAEETRGNTIFRYSLNGGILDTLVQASKLSPEMERYFYDVTVDTLRGQIYWTDSGGTAPDGSIYISAIMRASLDGDSVEVVLGGIVCGGFGSPTDLILTPDGNTLYWGLYSSQCDSPGLYKKDLANSDISVFEELPIHGAFNVVAIELDTHHEMIYWTHNDWLSLSAEPTGVRRASLNSLAADMIISGEVCDIALAHALSKIYWTRCKSNSIQRANFDGTDVENVIPGQNNISDFFEATNLAIDHVEGEIYWTEVNTGKIRRANLDGTEVEDLLSGLVVPTSIALNFGWDVRVGTESGEAPPDRIDLQSIYPNPFRESTTIAFSLAVPAHVRLEIFDPLGRRVEVLAAGAYPPGTFRVQWTPADRAGGVYFCRMTSENGAKTLPLVVRRD